MPGQLKVYKSCKMSALLAKSTDYDNRSCQQQVHIGSSLFEYVLPACVLALTLLVITPGISKAIESYLINTLNGDRASSSVVVHPWGTISSKAIVSDPSASVNPTANSVSFIKSTSSIQDKGSIVLVDVPQNPYDVVETVGVNGYTTALANTLTAYVQQLLKKGAITQNQANTLLDLANAGHSIASVERLIEQASTEVTKDKTSFKQSQILYNGQSYAPYELAGDMIAVYCIQKTAGCYPNVSHDNTDSLAHYQLDRNGAGTLTTDFIKLYQQAVSEGSLSDSIVGQVIDSLVYQVVSTSDTFATEVYNTADDETYDSVAKVYSSNSYSSILNYTASAVTHTNSANICTVGQGSDTGIHCE